MMDGPASATYKSAVMAIVLVRDARLHRDEGNVNRAMRSALHALVRSDPACNYGRETRRSGAIPAGRVRRGSSAVCCPERLVNVVEGQTLTNVIGECAHSACKRHIEGLPYC
jgi:hypothetical protein